MSGVKIYQQGTKNLSLCLQQHIATQPQQFIIAFIGSFCVLGFIMLFLKNCGLFTK